MVFGVRTRESDAFDDKVISFGTAAIENQPARGAVNQEREALARCFDSVMGFLSRGMNA